MRKILNFFFSDIVAKALSAAFIPLFAHFLGPAELGIFSEWFSLYNIGVAIVSIGMPSFILVLLSSAPDQEEELIEKTVSLFCVWLLVVVPVCAGAFLFLNKFWYGLSIIIAAVSFAIVNYLEAILRFRGTIRRYFHLQLVSTTSTAVVPLFFVLITATGFSRALGYTLGVAILGLIILTNFMRNFSLVKVDKAIKVEAFKFGVPIVLITGISWLKLGIDVQMLKEVSGYASSGLLFYSFQVISISSILAASLNRSSTPKFYKLLAANKLSKFTEFIFKISMIHIVLTIGVVVVSVGIVVLFLKQFLQSIDIILPMAAGIVFYGVGQFVASLFLFYRKTYLLTLCIGSSSIMHPIVSYYIIENFGSSKIGYSYLVSNFIFLVLVILVSVFMKRAVCKLGDLPCK